VLTRTATVAAAIGLAMLLVLALGAAPAPHATVPIAGQEASARRIVAVGDIHGAYEELVSVLRVAGIIDDDLKWSSDDTVFVQTGDFMDRGAGVRQVMDLLMRLQGEAPGTGGEGIVLLGNHEAMNLIGEFRDASAGQMAAFSGEDEDDVLDSAWGELQRVIEATNTGRMSSRRRRDLRNSWQENTSAERIAYVRAIGPSGSYGAWLRTLPLTATVDGIVFMHAGVAPEYAGWGLEALNQRVADEIVAMDGYREVLLEDRLLTSFGELREIIRAAQQQTGGLEWFDQAKSGLPTLSGAGGDSQADRQVWYAPLFRIQRWYALTERGPLWFRGLGTLVDPDNGAVLKAILTAVGARAIVGGHSPQIDGIISRFDGRLFMIDTGLFSSAYSGRPAAQEIGGEGAVALYADGTRGELQCPAAMPTSVSGARGAPTSL
jgi:hypothetical protein